MCAKNRGKPCLPTHHSLPTYLTGIIYHVCKKQMKSPPPPNTPSLQQQTKELLYITINKPICLPLPHHGNLPFYNPKQELNNH